MMGLRTARPSPREEELRQLGSDITWLTIEEAAAEAEEAGEWGVAIVLRVRANNERVRGRTRRLIARHKFWAYLENRLSRPL